MKVQPRQQIVEIWRSTVRSSIADGQWTWLGRDGSNSISDAEHLLCIMSPAAGIPTFRIDDPDQMADDVVDALSALGDNVEIPRRLVRILTEYLVRYSAEDGTPIFSGGSYFRSSDQSVEMSESQRSLDVVDSFAISVTLTLATIGFTRVFRNVVKRADLHHEIDELERLSSKRLTAAMIGMLRSFAVNVFETESTFGRALVETVNQSGQPSRVIVDGLRNELREVHAGLRDEVTIGSGAGTGGRLENPNLLFECGWSWGIVKEAPKVVGFDNLGPQRAGVAENAPYLYFTVVALEAIEALFAERTRLLGLLDEDQLRLAQSLQLRWDLTQKYWSTIARFGNERWPLEDLPWRTTDGVESDYFSLLVTSISVQDLVTRRAPDEALSRVGRVLAELAGRNRINRRSFPNDPVVSTHHPGFDIALGGSEEDDLPKLRWVFTDFSPVLLRRTIRIAGLLRDPGLRQQLLGLADEVWAHLEHRRLGDGRGRDLWDQPANEYPQLPRLESTPSWSYTKRVVDCLVTAAQVVGDPPVRGQRLTEYTDDLLAEAEHLFDQELLGGSSEAGPAIRSEISALRQKLERARRIQRDRPGSAGVLVSEVLSALDSLAAAREDVSGAS
ncbi:SCO2524 family protein [Rugosimonospora acidiphila]|uniref:SCO2524 family protein n=1 Tax=Rugosimonospora acidiphila TaxID=556531 RepID=A0ABP9SI24_9ACTN